MGLYYLQVSRHLLIIITSYCDSCFTRNCFHVSILDLLLQFENVVFSGESELYQYCCPDFGLFHNDIVCLSLIIAMQYSPYIVTFGYLSCIGCILLCDAWIVVFYFALFSQLQGGFFPVAVSHILYLEISTIVL